MMRCVPVKVLMMLLLPCLWLVSSQADQPNNSEFISRLPMIVERIRAQQSLERLNPDELGFLYRAYKELPRKDREIEFVKRPASAHPKMSFNGDLLALAEMMKYHKMQQDGVNSRWLNRLHNLGK